MNRSLSAKIARLLLLRRAAKRIEKEDDRLKGEILEQMEEDELEYAGVPSGAVTRYEETSVGVNAILLFERYGTRALAVMGVRVGDAKKLFGEKTLRTQRLLRKTGSRWKLLTKPAPKKKVVKIAC